MLKITQKSNLLDLSTVSNGDLAGLAIPGYKALHGFHSIHALFHLAKDHMLAIEPLSVGSVDENWEAFVLVPAFAMDKTPDPCASG